MKIGTSTSYLLAIVLLALGWALFSRHNSARLRQSIQVSGEGFELIAVTHRGEPFRKGTLLECLLEPLIPTGGVGAGGFQLRKPEQFNEWADSPLTAWLVYRGTNIQPGLTPPLFGARVVAANSSGRSIENPLPSVRRAQSNELLISVPLFAFPRDQDRIRLHFSPPAKDEADRKWATFEIKNPFREAPAVWTPEQLPKPKVTAGETVILQSLTVDPVACRFQPPGPGWDVPHCSIQDPEGNLFQSSLKSWNSKEPEIKRGFTWTLETNQPWRIQATFVRTTNFAAADMRTLRLAANAPETTLTNSSGQVCSCTFEGGSIRVAGKAGNGPPYWIITAATNVASGRPLEFFMIDVWSGVTGGSISKFWPLRDGCTNVVIEFADPKVVTAEWYVAPHP